MVTSVSTLDCVIAGVGIPASPGKGFLRTASVRVPAKYRIACTLYRGCAAAAVTGIARTPP